MHCESVSCDALLVGVTNLSEWRWHEECLRPRICLDFCSRSRSLQWNPGMSASAAIDIQMKISDKQNHIKSVKKILESREKNCWKFIKETVNFPVTPNQIPRVTKSHLTYILFGRQLQQFVKFWRVTSSASS